MSDKKRRKPKEIHVDNLIIKANKVVFQDEEGNIREEPREGWRQPAQPIRDPWGFLFPHGGPGPEAPAEENKAEEPTTEEPKAEEHVEKPEEEGPSEENRPRWSWI